MNLGKFSFMDPVALDLKHKVALVLMILVFAFLGSAAGYILYALGTDPRMTLSFHYWIKHNHYVSPSMLGSVVGAAFFYIKHLTK